MKKDNTRIVERYMWDNIDEYAAWLCQEYHGRFNIQEDKLCREFMIVFKEILDEQANK